MMLFFSVFPTTSGIYRITNTINGKRYIGSAFNLQKHLSGHRRTLRNGTHKNAHLQAAFDTYGESAFLAETIEHIAPKETVDEIKEYLLEREQYYLDTSLPEYNILKLAGSNLGMKMSEAAKAKMSLAKKNNPDYIAMLVARNISKTGVPSGRKGVPTSEAAKAKMSLAKKGKKQSATLVAKRALALRGKKRSPENIAKSHTLEAQARRTASLRTPEVQAKMSESAKRFQALKRQMSLKDNATLWDTEDSA